MENPICGIRFFLLHITHEGEMADRQVTVSTPGKNMKIPPNLKTSQSNILIGQKTCPFS